MRIPSRLVYAVIVAAGCGADVRPGKDAAVPADLAPQDSAPAAGDACALTVRCIAVVQGANCSGTFCSLTGCPTGCEPFV